MLIYKICDAEAWRTAEREGVFRGAAIDLNDGYIHFSMPHQVAETAAKHFAGRHNLILVAIEAEALGAALVREPARGGALFPHLYGTLPMTAVVWVKEMPLDPDGRHILPALD
jgi:uncharacterized protein (DUF952 family)